VKGRMRIAIVRKYSKSRDIINRIRSNPSGESDVYQCLENSEKDYLSR
jgi:hypothetical protein